VSKTPDHEVFIGYWSRENPAIAAGLQDDNNYCVKWDSNSRKDLFDGSWRFGRFLGVFGLMLGLPLLIALIYILCCRLPTRAFPVMIGVAVYLSASCLLLLCGLASDICKLEDCQIGPGGIIAIVDFFLWMVGALLIYKILERSRELDLADENDDGTEDGEKSPRKPLPTLPMSETATKDKINSSSSEVANLPALPLSETYATTEERVSDIEAPESNEADEHRPKRKKAKRKKPSSAKRKTRRRDHPEEVD